MAQLITRGLSTVRQTLVVWGLQISSPIEIVVGAGPGGTQRYDEYLKQQKTVWFKEEYKIEGAKEFEIANTILIYGIIVNRINEVIDINGIKNNSFICESNILGSKQFNLTENLNLEGLLLANIEESYELKGFKNYPLLEQVSIKGKQDNSYIFSVLTVLDIL